MHSLASVAIECLKQQPGRHVRTQLQATRPVSADWRKGMTAPLSPGWRLCRAPVSRYPLSPLAPVEPEGGLLFPFLCHPYSCSSFCQPLSVPSFFPFFYVRNSRLGGLLFVGSFLSPHSPRYPGQGSDASAGFFRPEAEYCTKSKMRLQARAWMRPVQPAARKLMKYSGERPWPQSGGF